MKIDFTNFFTTSGISPENFHRLAGHSAGFADKIPEFLAKIKKRNQGFYQIFEDADFQAEVEEIKKFAEKSREKFTDIVLCGTGGSALGTLAIQESLLPKIPSFNHVQDKQKIPRLHVLENIDAEVIAELTEFLDFSKTLFLIISKSGGTIETISQYKFFRRRLAGHSGILTEKNLELKNHFVFITGKTGFLREEAEREGIQTFSVPENIGGRFSVLTAVGLVPAALMGINIDELLAGGAEISTALRGTARDFQSTDFAKNLPFQLALAQFLALQNGQTQNVLMPYSAKMKNFGNWWAQLLAESTGKDGKGITPIPAQGVTDQHSQLQLFVDGPADKLVIFMEILPHPHPLLEGEGAIRRKSNADLKTFEKLMQAELRGTAQSLTEKNRPNLTIQVGEISPRNFGKLFMLFMGATAFLGEFMGINAFNQPGVERGKNLAKKFFLD